MSPTPAPRDLYTQGVDFTALAIQYPGFAKKLKSNKQLDFSDPESIRQLTKALLHRDFNLNIALPEDRLCPPVPNRFNYVVWIQALLDSTSDDFRGIYDPGREVVGLDIGTGASAIYPLLACRQRSEWRFLATETDSTSMKYAKENVIANGLQQRVRLVPTKLKEALLPMDMLKSFKSIDFVMTNPPFYASEAEMHESAKKKQRPPFSACTGGPMEMITPGGELQFIFQLIVESMNDENKDKIQWFTSMLGKLSSVSSIVEKLKEHGCTNYAVTEFVQGQKTRRWGVAWSWQELRPSTVVVRGIPGFEKKLLPFPGDFIFKLVSQSIEDLGSHINELVKTLDLQFKWKPSLAMGVGMAMSDVWSRKARRKQARTESEDDEMVDDTSKTTEKPALVFKLFLEGQSDCLITHIQWLQGRDSVLFESFCGWLKRKIESK